MAVWLCKRKNILFTVIVLFTSGYLSYNQFHETIQKLQSKKKPVNNMTYPAFKHPLAPPYPYPYQFLINQPEKCKDRNPFLIIMVIGETKDEFSRQVIRETWGNESNYDVDVLRIFLVAQTEVANDQIQRMLEMESETHGDIIQQDFQDTYYNLTLKTMMGMEWVSKFCPTASYVMKIDSDMFLNVEYLVHHLLHPELPVRTNYFTGVIVANTSPLRDTRYKWYVPEEVYPNKTYPPYCAGPGYVFSADMAKKIYDVSQEIRMIPMEDSFMGICLYELKIPPTRPPPNIFKCSRIEYDRCKFLNLVMVHHYRGEELKKVWDDFWAKRLLAC